MHSSHFWIPPIPRTYALPCGSHFTGLDIRQRVQQLGYEPVGPVASGKDAIEHALTLHPDVILMDIFLKGPMDGIQTAATIRSQYPCPAIYITAHADQSTIDRAKATEPAGYLLKPINEWELQTAIELALRGDTDGGAPEITEDVLGSPVRVEGKITEKKGVQPLPAKSGARADPTSLIGNL